MELPSQVLKHNKRVPLQIGGCAVLALFAFGALVRNWRRPLWLSGIGAVPLVLLSLL
jgi:hypothetical protein